MSVAVLAPVSGRVVPLTEVGDPVFAQSIVGPGIAVEPADEATEAVAPVDGVVAALHPHAFVVTSPTGVSVLVHLGIDTVRLKGEGFALHVVKGETVRAGQRLVDWSPPAVRAAGFAAVCPVIALDAAPEALRMARDAGTVSVGAELFSWSGG
ncbi:PTS system N-acetylglucosamine-specific IIA component [Actinoalloteichus hoggarensis]|uniref:Glucose-specific phosphotransferase enzyme IIA component n=1 Tax=Actinoalloteichus hoggarensis TaxID=1470176 RepID=A0A221W298_9PSEU|nr:PTS glucose transporter subunit IIA [Actinoalloteichus hoggarensis]ASO19925.1 Glucose-specific phosphotransferase enzyme IIA component [Actinoalloteichus hoggarensis]MBB5919365.1 PTS system N-acetylglucosamine-specific IIA component [Actinoalloteichus hoggarensis]